MSETKATEASNEGPELQDIGGEEYDQETGEVPSLDTVAEATTAKVLRGAPLSYEEIQRITTATPGTPSGIMGWFPKIGETAKKGNKPAVAGSRVKGQIVGVISTSGRFGQQTSIIVAGRLRSPAYLRNGKPQPAIDKDGRWIIGIDATLTELPGHVGDVLDLEVEKRGGPGERHTYKRVDLWFPQ